LTTMSHAELLYLGDQNLAAFNCELTRWQENYEIVESDDLIMTVGADAFPASNFVMRLGSDQRPVAGEMFDRLLTFYGKRRRGFNLYLRGHVDAELENICEDRGMIRIGSPPGMHLAAPLPEWALDRDVTVRVVADQEGMADFAAVTVASYKSLGLPEDTGRRLFARPERMCRPHVLPVVAYDGGVPAAAAMAFLSHGIAGIYWVGTVETHRRRGLADQCTRLAGNQAFARGARQVVLQASPMGEPVYRTMGYREFTRYPWYMWFYQPEA